MKDRGARQLSCLVELNKIELERSKGELKRYALEDISRRMADELLKKGVIELKEIDGDFNIQLVGSIYIASEFEKERKKKEIKTAASNAINDLIDVVTKEVSNWGSYYGDSHIDKNKVFSILYEAKRKVVGK